MTIRTHALAPFVLGMSLLLGDPPPAAATADGPDLFRVTGVASWDRLNMRGGPAASYRVVGRIPHDARGIENLGCGGTWCQVRWQGVIGFANNRYLAEDWFEFPPALTYRVVGVAWGDALNVRTGPSAGHPVIGAIPPDGVDIVQVGGCDGEWCRIRHDDTFGWVNTQYLAPDL
jgi:uncharacterized protein YraI